MTLQNDILQVPIRCRWHGWESDTYSLRNAGWGLFASEGFFDYAVARRVSLAAKSPDNKLVIMGEMQLPMRYFYQNQMSLLEMLRQTGVEMQTYRSNDRVIVHNLSSQFWSAADEMLPVDGFANIDMSERSIGELKLFSYQEAAKEIVIPQMSVGDCLDRILQIQYPKQKSLRDLSEVQKPIIQAKIYSLAA